MTLRFLTTLTNPPAGFSLAEPSRKLLLAGPLVLLTSDSGEIVREYASELERIKGVLVSPGAAPQIVALHEQLWQLVVPEAQLPQLQFWLSPLLSTLQQLLETEDRLTVYQRLLDRRERSLGVTHRDYQRVNQKLLNKVEDLTRAQEEIIQLNQVLELRVRERTADLEQSLEQVHQAQEQLIQAEKLAALGSMVAGVAHEINTPLGNCVLAASSLDDTVTELLESVHSGVVNKQDFLHHMESLKSGFELLSTNLKRGADLVGRFKQVAADQSNEERRRFSFSEMLEDTVAAMSPRLKRARCQVSCECDERIALDSYPGDFSQILMNLIMNSLNHGFDLQSDGEISIVVEQLQQSLRLEYRDNGRGLSAESRERLFEPFYTTNREQGGTGLGMPIIHNLISQRLGGSIRLLSPVGEGVHFVIETPLYLP